jgi:nitrogen fixation NifU-like protein
MDLYAQNIMDHYKNPRNKGVLDGANIIHAEANYSCGDSATVHVLIEDDIIKDIMFEGEGCAISQAGLSIVTGYVKGKSVKEIMRLGSDDIEQMLGVPIGERRKKCALLNLLTIKNAILKFQNGGERESLKWYDLMD